MSFQLVNDRRQCNLTSNNPKALEPFESKSEKVRHFIKISRYFQNKIYEKESSYDYTRCFPSGLDQSLKSHIQRAIKFNDSDEEENVQKIFNTIKNITESNKCKTYTLVLIYATAYCHEQNNTILIPIIRVECKEKFTVFFLSKTGKKFTSINKLICSISLPSSLVCFPKHGKYQYDENIGGIALEFSNIHFYRKPLFDRKLESIIMEFKSLDFYIAAGLGILTAVCTLPLVVPFGASLIKKCWISYAGYKNSIQVILNKLPFPWIINRASPLIKLLENTCNVIKRAYIIREVLFNSLIFFSEIALKLALLKPSGDEEKCILETEKTGRIFNYKFSSEFNFDDVLKYDVELWKSYVAKILQDAESLMKEKGINFNRKLWFVHCYTQEKTCSQFSAGENSLNEFLKLHNRKMGIEEKFENNNGLDNDSYCDLDFIVIYHDETEKKCVYIFQIDINTLISQGEVLREIDGWTEVHYKKYKCMLRKFNYKNVEYVCLVEDYTDAETILPWISFLRNEINLSL